MKILLVIAIIFFSTLIFPSEKRVEKIESKSMNKKIPITIILPSNYSENKKYNVIYVLHGWGQSHNTITNTKRVKELADRYEIIYVFPNGGWNSWYIDSEKKLNSKYSTFISKELVNYIDKNYSTNKNKEGRAITGFSMGGFGALYNGINNYDIFGNVGAISGGVNVEKFQKKWGIYKVINNNWEDYNIKDIVIKLKEKNDINLIIDVGEKDFFIKENRELHEKLKELNIIHNYSEREGMHTISYWKKSLEIQSEFFYKKFEEKEKNKIIKE